MRGEVESRELEIAPEFRPMATRDYQITLIHTEHQGQSLHKTTGRSILSNCAFNSDVIYRSNYRRTDSKDIEACEL